MRNVKGLNNQSIGDVTASPLGSLQREEGHEVCTSERDLLLQLQFQDICIVKSLEMCSILPLTQEIRDPLTQCGLLSPLNKHFLYHPWMLWLFLCCHQGKAMFVLVSVPSPILIKNKGGKEKSETRG